MTEVLVEGKRYRTIVVDPPWPYERFVRNVGGRYADRTHQGWAADGLAYQSLPIDAIAALPVSDLAADDAWLWLWATNRYLRDAFDVAHSWGFRYGQTIVWHKSDGHPRFPALVAPNRAEFLLVCKRGQPKRGQPWASNVVEIPFNPARLEHSQKPDAFLDLVEQVSPGPYAELFSRRARFGWDYPIGNQALGGAAV